MQQEKLVKKIIELKEIKPILNTVNFITSTFTGFKELNMEKTKK